MDINQLTEFAGNHTLLVLALLATIVMLVSGELQSRFSKVKGISPAEATRLLNHDNAIMVDMREDKDYRTGHIVNAIHAPASAESDAVKLTKYRDKPVIVYCQRGRQSAAYCNKLSKQGFETVYNLQGGVQAWQKAELPLTTNN